MNFKNQSFTPCVVACILDDQDRVLLTRRNIAPFFNQWVMPGGKVDPGETDHQALRREVQEEVGLAVEIAEKVGVYQLEADTGARSYRIHYYRSRAQSTELKPNPAEVAEADWVSADDGLPRLGGASGMEPIEPDAA